MFEQLEYSIQRYYQDQMHSLFQIKAYRNRTLSRQAEMKKKNIKKKLDFSFFLNPNYELQVQSETDLYQQELEYEPPNRFKKHIQLTKQFSQQQQQEDYVLPLIPLAEPRRKDNNLSTYESEPMTRKNLSMGSKQGDKMRTFSTRIRQMRAGVLLIDVDNPYLLQFFKKYSTNQASKMDIFLEITKTQLANFLSKSLGSLQQIIRLLNFLNLPASITYHSFKQFLISLNDLNQSDILNGVFHAYDNQQKGYIHISDVFEMFKAGGAAAIDGNFIFKAFQEIQNKDQSTIQGSPKVKKNISIKSPQKRKKLIITMINETGRRNSMKQKPQQVDNYNVVNFLDFKQIYKDQLPEMFKAFIRAFNEQNI